MSQQVQPVDRDIVVGILSALKDDRKTITYGELSKKIYHQTGRKLHPHIGFNSPLGRIQDYCSECKLPCLSAVVVNQLDVPGSGFIPYYRSQNPSDTRTDGEIIHDEQERCSKQQDWAPLLSYCNIQSELIANSGKNSLDFTVVNWSRLVSIIDQYESTIESFRPKELYKWEAAKCFQEHWNIDANNFLDMLTASLEETSNLLSSNMYFAKGMILAFAEQDPEGVRSSFRTLFNEQIPLVERLASFSADMTMQLEALNTKNLESGKHPAKNHFQDAHAMSVYLALARNSKHYLFKPDLFNEFSQLVGYQSPKEKYQKVAEYEKLCNLILNYLNTHRQNLIQKSDELLDNLKDIDPEHHFLVQDIIYFSRDNVSKNWSYAPGEQASQWNDFHTAGTMAIGWNEIGNPSQYKTKNELKAALSKAYGKENPSNDTNTIWSFVHDIKPGDIIWVRKGLTTVIGRGIVKSDFYYDPKQPHYQSIRNITWENIEAFDTPNKFAQKTISELSESTSITVSELEDLAAQAMSNAGWWPSEDIYSPNVTEKEWIELIKHSSVFTHDALVMLGCLRNHGCQASVTELSQSFGRSPNWYQNQAISLAQRIAIELPAVKPYNADGETKWWPILFVGKDQKKDKPGTFVWRLRNELVNALNTVSWENYQLDEKTSKKKQYWWLTASPKIWSLSNTEPGKENSYTIYNDNGAPRRVHANFLQVRPGDVVVGYEASPIRKIVSLCEISKERDDENIYFKKIRDLIDPISLDDIKADEILSNSQFMKNPNGSLFKLTAEEYNRIVELSGEGASPISSVETTKPFDDNAFLNEVFVSKSSLNTMKRLLFRKKNLILQGAPGTGKTFCAKRLAWDIMGEEDNSRICFVQFHQNTTYDDIVAGYRPSNDGGFEAAPGEFLRFCNKAANDPDKRPWFFIIDEINRANISKVFGELLMLIEAGHRGEALRLPLLDRYISIPENLYLIGMMNTADRGLALIDYALRRRFAFFEMEPAFNSERFKEAIAKCKNDKLVNLVHQVESLNHEIEDDSSLGSGFRIGHSYFLLDDLASDEEVEDIVDYELAPLIQEYWFDAPEIAASKINQLKSVF